MRITEPATQVNDKAVASVLRSLYIKKNTDHRNMVKSYPVVGFISCLFVCLLFSFKMGKCELYLSILLIASFLGKHPIKYTL